MIQANELRLGNYINHKELDIVKVISISSKVGDHESVFVESLKDGLDHNFNLDEDLKPIPITEEILLKCGFEKHIEEFCLNNNIVLFSFMIKDTIIYLIESSYDNEPLYLLLFKGRNNVSFNFNEPKIYINSVHQLQNLYFVLTGKELEVKL